MPSRYGFNSEGLVAARQRLIKRESDKKEPGIVGANVGRNKVTDDPVGDFVEGVKHLGPMVDYLVINVSSPNTPGLRMMQAKKQLSELIVRVSK